MTTKTSPAVAEYLARTKAALADLPGTEVEEIIEDIGPHLSEVAAELGEDVSVEAMSERLGTPEQYASDLRAAAGYPPAAPVPAAPGTFAARFSLWALVIGVAAALVAGLAFLSRGQEVFGPLLLFSLPLLVAVALVFSGTARTSDVDELAESRAARSAGLRIVRALPDGLVGYVRSLRPAWWGLRALVLAGAAVLAVYWRSRLDPGYVLLPLVALVLLVGFGGRARTDPRWRWAIAPANFFAAGVLVAALGAVLGIVGRLPWYLQESPAMVVDVGSEYVAPSNLYAFGPDGRPLPEFYLYDQDGRPVNVPRQSCARTYEGEETNRFPQPRLDYDPRTGQCVEHTGVPFTVAVPRSSTEPSAPPSISTPPTAPSK